LRKDCVDPGGGVDFLLFRATKGGTDNWIIEHRLQVRGIVGYQGPEQQRTIVLTTRAAQHDRLSPISTVSLPSRL